ncbi:MAG: hypothetical protein LBV17_00435 [Treponema sp.]|jgi:site-specific recombinase XerD|nr:hypothetical protein [Treponema sp.]
MRLEKITVEAVEEWFDKLIAEKYKHTIINGIFGTLRTMLRWVAKKKIVPGGDPLIGVERFINDRKQIKIITQDEFKALFVNDWKKVRDNDLLRYTGISAYSWNILLRESRETAHHSVHRAAFCAFRHFFHHAAHFFKLFN